MNGGEIVSMLTAIVSLSGTIASIIAAHRITAQKIDQLKQAFEGMSRRVNELYSLVERMAVVEQSAKSAHHRIDELREEVKK